MSDREDIQNLKERQGKLEQTVTDLSESTKRVAHNQEGMQVQMTHLATAMESVVSTLKGKEGRIDARTLMSTLALIFTVVIGLGSMFVLPGQVRTEIFGAWNSSEHAQMLKRTEIMEQMGLSLLTDQAANKEKFKTTDATLEALQRQVDEHHRLPAHPEAMAWHAAEVERATAIRSLQLRDEAIVDKLLDQTLDMAKIVAKNTATVESIQKQIDTAVITIKAKTP